MVAIKRPNQRKRTLLSVQNLVILFIVIYVTVFLLGGDDNVSTGKDTPNIRAGAGVASILDSSKQHLKTNQQRQEEPLENPQHFNQVVSKDDSPDKAAAKTAGTHTIENGYFADFSYERETPAFRQESIPNWKESQDHVTSLVPPQGGASSLTSCQYLSDDRRLLMHEKCRQEGTTLVAYNTQSFPRTWCGKVIAPQSAIKMDGICNEPVKLLPTTVTPVDGSGMPPIVIQSKDGLIQNLEDVSCNVPCQQEKDMDGDDRFIAGTSWKIFQSDDDPAKNKAALVERNAYRRDEYYSTSSFKSSVPLSVFDFDKYNIFAPAVGFDQVEDSASYFVNDRCSSPVTRRQRWVGSVAAKYKVAHYGKCDHDTNTPAGMSLESMQDRLALRRKHKFDLAFEFGNEKDHISPQVWESLSSDTLSVILGAQNIKDHFPAHSFVSTGDFQTWELLSQFLVELAKDKSKWESYHAWRSDEKAKAAFEKRYNFTRTSPTCRMCRWAYAKKYGLGWNHEQQQVQENAIPRRLCLGTDEKLVTRPFRESWHTHSSDGVVKGLVKAGTSEQCTEETSETSLEAVGLDRAVIQHDNVVDFTITSSGSKSVDHDVVLRMEFQVKNTDGAYFPNVHTLLPNVRGAIASSIAIQDRKNKLTILANWDTKIWSPSEGIVEVTIHADGERWHDEDEIRRVRVIVEDFNTLHDKTTEFFPSSFGKMMMQDFVDPVELFYFEQERR